MRSLFPGLLLLASLPAGAQAIPSDSIVRPAVQGTVLELRNGQRQPLIGASLYWLQTTVGTVTDGQGQFRLPWPAPHAADSARRLVVSYVGYQADTLTLTTPDQPLTITLRAEQTLAAVTVTGAPGQIDRLNPIQTELITQRTLAKAACCNLSESFETNASVSVSFADAVTGAKQIQFLGLGGQYVQTNVENIPTVRGLATTFGLNYIPGTWITSIDVGKGAGSVVNGYESMSGQLNVELQKPDSPDRLFLNGYVNSFGRVEGNVNWSQPLSKRWSMGVLGHASTLRTELDQNNDGFRDLPLYTQVNAINRYKYSSDRFMAQVGVKALYEDRDGGQLARFGPGRYSFGNTTRRLEFFAKMAVLYPEKPYKGLGLILNGLTHEQSANFGFRPYSGQQRTLYANLIYQNILGTTNNSYKLGLSYLLDDYREQLAPIQRSRTESVPGVFAEYTYTDADRLTLVLGGRFDYHNLFGAQWTPRAHLKYDLTRGLTLRASAGRGFRVPNALIENFGYFVSSRAIINQAELQPEISWNYGGSLSQDFQLLGLKSSVVLDYHRTTFRNQLIVDVDHPGELYFYNLSAEGRGAQSFANSLQLELNVQPARRFDLKAAYRLFDVRQSMGGPFGESRLLPRMMVPRDRVLINAGYALPFDKWKYDATVQWNGPRRIPYLRAGYVHSSYADMPLAYSPGFVTLNAQVSRAFRSGWEVYLGGENLTGFRQDNPIVGAADPFGPSFDAGSQVWGPVTGAMVYAGFRFKPQH
ncbi:TonB-dependent receptor [Spirosoma luteolum]